MALTSKFYDGVVTEGDRAQNRGGVPDYGVYGLNDFKVVPHPSIPYAVLVKAGKAHGHGVSDIAAADEVVQCPTLASGVRWDVIAVRRNWQPLLGGPSTLVAVSAGANPVLPVTLKKNPGVEDDQPLALVRWQGGTSAPIQIIDLRCWANNGGLSAVDTLALTYLAKPGATVEILGDEWINAVASNGTSTWKKYGRQQDVLAPLAAPVGWRFDGNVMVENFGTGKKVTVAITVARTGASITVAASQNYLPIGVPIPAAARGNVGGISQAGEVSGGGPMAYSVQSYLSPGSGQILWRRASSFTFVTNAQFSFNCTYYIP